ncbi:MAG: hypothetical protein JNK21_14150 [Rhodospirillaceae bacterium]|nr:hypothetical protein [Rhodospirillaceae bacterium]
MEKLNTGRVAVIFAAVIGGWHLFWSLLVAAGVAQAILDFVFWMHMLKPAFSVEPFDFTKSATLVLVTAVLGYVIGWIFAWLWNVVHRD